MISRFQWMALLSGLVILATAGPAAAQLEDNLGGLIGENAKGYLRPLPKALSGTMNSAIFRTGDVPLAGLTFSIGIEAMVMSFGDDDQTYRPTDPPGFNSIEDREVPTVVGNTKAVPVQGVGGTVLYYPGGFDIENFGLAVPQVTFGSVHGTRGVIRWIPSIDLGDSDLGELGLFGFGAQHSISRYFPTLPVAVAAGFFYQTFHIGDIVETKAFHLNVTGSKAYGILSPYAGIGFDTFSMDAEYTYEADESEETIKVDFDRESNLHLTLGINLKVPGVMVHSEYNIAAVNGFAFGLNFGM